MCSHRLQGVMLVDVSLKRDFLAINNIFEALAVDRFVFREFATQV